MKIRDHPPPKARRRSRRQLAPAGDLVDLALQNYRLPEEKSTPSPELVFAEQRHAQLRAIAIDATASSDARECATHDLILEFSSSDPPTN
jgi:hypothetical protein